ncbi:MAG TPA: hypothetical protein PKW21_08855 [Rhabdaerophilum sp.]|nr:hypothetical protein [Rhabdaerophilum sp.]
MGKMIANGLHTLGVGQLAAMVTYLRHELAAVSSRPPFPESFVLRRLAAGDLKDYRRLFRAIGGEWLWFSRLRLRDEELASVLGDPAVEAYAIAGPMGDAGLLELDFRDLGASELTFCGLMSTLGWAGR